MPCVRRFFTRAFFAFLLSGPWPLMRNSPSVWSNMHHQPPQTPLCFANNASKSGQVVGLNSFEEYGSFDFMCLVQPSLGMVLLVRGLEAPCSLRRPSDQRP